MRVFFINENIREIGHKKRVEVDNVNILQSQIAPCVTILGGSHLKGSLTIKDCIFKYPWNGNLQSYLLPPSLHPKIITSC